LTSHISRLERELQTLKEEHAVERSRFRDEAEVLRQERDAERLRAAQVEALQAVIEAERQRVEDLRADREQLRADRDRWAEQAATLAVPAAPPAGRRGWWPFRRAG
jgi:chromosome segregation ATPase